MCVCVRKFPLVILIEGDINWNCKWFSVMKVSNRFIYPSWLWSIRQLSKRHIFRDQTRRLPRFTVKSTSISPALPPVTHQFAEVIANKKSFNRATSQDGMVKQVYLLHSRLCRSDVEAALYYIALILIYHQLMRYLYRQLTNTWKQQRTCINVMFIKL